MAKIATVKYYRVKPRWLMVKIVDENGQYGWGEATLEGHDLAVEGCLDEMIPRIIGQEANDIENIWQTFWRHGFYRGGPVFMSAISGIDIALWDLKGGRNLKVPIYELLGGKVRNKVQVYCWIGGDRPSDIEAAAKKRLEQGLTCVKMNATEDLGWIDSPSALDSTVERLKQVKALGLDAGLDFHGRCHKAMAKQLARALEPHRPLFIEEPILVEHPEAIKKLSDQTVIPIAFGERLYTRWDIKRFLEDSSVDILQPDIAHAGGISETKRIATMAEAYDVAIAPHCPLGPVAFAASVQVALSSPNFAILEMSLGMHYNTEAGDIDLLTYIKDPSVFDLEAGHVKAPTGYGLGIEIDEEMVARIAKETDPWQCKTFHGPDGSIRECIVKMSNKPLEVLVYGLGAIGSFYAFILSRSEHVHLTVAARSNFDAVTANGISIDSQNHGKHHVEPHKVCRTVAKASKKFDFIVCTNKAVDQLSTAADIEPGVGDNTSIVIIQNGVGNEDAFRERFPSATIISCVTWVGARQPEPGFITHTTSEDMQVGLYPNKTGSESRDNQHLAQFESLLSIGKTIFQIVPNIQVQRWEKVVWNAAWNSLTALTLMDTHAWLSSSDLSTPMTRKLMKEVIDVANALGVPLEYELIDRLLEKILVMPPIGSSMRTDYENGKPMEVEVILGYPVRKGKELGIDVATIETLYSILLAINKRLISAQSK
ncbi:enolase C-terminal domain-like protein [Fusarium redolens]|uniref:Enolase C-terminal domain-like protein n=1 Tax=Fusarium redolens TaxID=48865 RepID=A0A9P9GMQ3_FUSRE|nr:enolase C-terminal domain-like protein [Fusarium redolens]KAH7240804.1 enolase C-terminal domain-like protein [Fusarium redolens]